MTAKEQVVPMKKKRFTPKAAAAIAAVVLAAATAWHLYVWYRDNVYCGRCGHKLVHSEKLRMLSCPDCNNMVFPKIAPAVIVGVTNGRKILMTKWC